MQSFHPHTEQSRIPKQNPDPDTRLQSWLQKDISVSDGRNTGRQSHKITMELKKSPIAEQHHDTVGQRFHVCDDAGVNKSALPVL